MNKNGFEIRGKSHAICPVMLYDPKIAQVNSHFRFQIWLIGEISIAYGSRNVQTWHLCGSFQIPCGSEGHRSYPSAGVGRTQPRAACTGGEGVRRGARLRHQEP